MAECEQCGKTLRMLEYRNRGFCKDCDDQRELAARKGLSIDDFLAEKAEEKRIIEDKKRALEEVAQRAKTMPVTTEMFTPDLKIIERKCIITAEVVVGMNIFKDLFAGIRNLVGGRSGVVQDALRDIREQVIGELKMEASRAGANAVIAVDLDYQEIGATGSTMLMLVASGTAVVIEEK